MTVLENITAGINLMGTTFNTAIGVFSTEPLSYFVGAGLFVIGIVAVKKIIIPKLKDRSRNAEYESWKSKKKTDLSIPDRIEVYDNRIVEYKYGNNSKIPSHIWIKRKD